MHCTQWTEVKLLQSLAPIKCPPGSNMLIYLHRCNNNYRVDPTEEAKAVSVLSNLPGSLRSAVATCYFLCVPVNTLQTAMWSRASIVSRYLGGTSNALCHWMTASVTPAVVPAKEAPLPPRKVYQTSHSFASLLPSRSPSATANALS